jgi:hypothetical protein
LLGSGQKTVALPALYDAALAALHRTDFQEARRWLSELERIAVS